MQRTSILGALTASLLACTPVKVVEVERYQDQVVGERTEVSPGLWQLRLSTEVDDETLVLGGELVRECEQKRLESVVRQTTIERSFDKRGRSRVWTLWATGAAGMLGGGLVATKSDADVLGMIGLLGGAYLLGSATGRTLETIDRAGSPSLVEVVAEQSWGVCDVKDLEGAAVRLIDTSISGEFDGNQQWKIRFDELTETQLREIAATTGRLGTVTAYGPFVASFNPLFVQIEANLQVGKRRLAPTARTELFDEPFCPTCLTGKACGDRCISSGQSCPAISMCP